MGVPASARKPPGSVMVGTPAMSSGAVYRIMANQMSTYSWPETCICATVGEAMGVVGTSSASTCRISARIRPVYAARCSRIF